MASTMDYRLQLWPGQNMGGARGGTRKQSGRDDELAGGGGGAGASGHGQGMRVELVPMICRPHSSRS